MSSRPMPDMTAYNPLRAALMKSQSARPPPPPAPGAGGAAKGVEVVGVEKPVLGVGEEQQAQAKGGPPPQLKSIPPVPPVPPPQNKYHMLLDEGRSKGAGARSQSDAGMGVGVPAVGRGLPPVGGTPGIVVSLEGGPSTQQASGSTAQQASGSATQQTSGGSAAGMGGNSDTGGNPSKPKKAGQMPAWLKQQLNERRQQLPEGGGVEGVGGEPGQAAAATAASLAVQVHTSTLPTVEEVEEVPAPALLTEEEATTGRPSALLATATGGALDPQHLAQQQLLGAEQQQQQQAGAELQQRQRGAGLQQQQQGAEQWHGVGAAELAQHQDIGGLPPHQDSRAASPNPQPHPSANMSLTAVAPPAAVAPSAAVAAVAPPAAVAAVAPSASVILVYPACLAADMNHTAIQLKRQASLASARNQPGSSGMSGPGNSRVSGPGLDGRRTVSPGPRSSRPGHVDGDHAAWQLQQQGQGQPQAALESAPGFRVEPGVLPPGSSNVWR